MAQESGKEAKKAKVNISPKDQRKHIQRAAIVAQNVKLSLLSRAILMPHVLVKMLIFMERSPMQQDMMRPNQKDM